MTGAQFIVLAVTSILVAAPDSGNCNYYAK